MLKIRGLDKLSRDAKAAERAIAELEGELATINFDPHDPASIETAIASVEQIIDERVGAYANNPFVGPIVDEMKANYRQAILDAAAEARLGGSAD